MNNNIQNKINLRKANERGHADHGWLNSYHTFSFANYYDSKYMGFRSLRVINDDTVGPGKGFGTHAHKDMEIISFVIEGALEHKDSMGNGSVINAGSVQRISAGTGIEHSEFNHSSDHKVHFLQIWITPQEQGLTPSYEEIHLNGIEMKDGLKLLGSPNGQGEGVTIHQDAYLYYGQLNQGESIAYTIKRDRGVWIQVIKGELLVKNINLSKGDGLSIEEADQLEITTQSSAEFLLFDLQ